MIPDRRVVLVLLLPLLCAFDPFRGKSGAVERGNAELAAGKVKEALKHYQQAGRELPEEPGVQYNLGIAYHRLGQMDQARQALLRATSATDPELGAKASYNLGNVQLEQKRYKEAVDAYRRALRLRPGHRPSQWNLELALRRLQEEKKKQDQKNKDKNKDKDKKDQKKDQQKKDGKQDQKRQPQGKQDQKKQPPQDRKQEQAKKKQPPPEMNQTLDALDRNDKNLQRQRARMQGAGDLSPPAKDW